MLPGVEIVRPMDIGLDLDVDENGEQFVVSSGALRAKYRQIDEARSTPEHPIHPWAEPIPITPDKVYEYNIQMLL